MGYSCNFQTAEIKNVCSDLRSYDQDKCLKKQVLFFMRLQPDGGHPAEPYSKVKLRPLHLSGRVSIPHFYSAVIEAHNVAAEVDLQDWRRTRFNLRLSRVYTERPVHAKVDPERKRTD